MLEKISFILILVFISRVESGCTDIPNEDKIDCVQHESWTVQSCLAKGCCHAEVAGFPACYYPFPNKHEARCVMSVPERHDCGSADTTEISCIKSGCCWQMTPGAPFCYRAKEVVTDATEGTTDSSATVSPQCQVSTSDRKDCGDAKTTPTQCVNKGCCWQMTPGAPFCFYKKEEVTDNPTDSTVTESTDSEATTSDESTDGTPITDSPPDGPCSTPTFERRDCGDSKTTASECEKKGCCWEKTPGAPFCYHKNGSY